MLPLRSSPITEPSSLLRVAPPLCPASVLSHLWGFHLCFSLDIRATGSHVPHKSLYQVHAVFMPEAIWPVIRYPPDLSQGNDYPSVLTSSLRFRHFIIRFTCVRLLDTHLTESCSAFSVTLTTPALYRSSLRWFEASTCMAASRGPPSSLMQHGCTKDFVLLCAFVAHSRQHNGKNVVGAIPNVYPDHPTLGLPVTAIRAHLAAHPLVLDGVSP